MNSVHRKHLRSNFNNAVIMKQQSIRLCKNGRKANKLWNNFGKKVGTTEAAINRILLFQLNNLTVPKQLALIKNPIKTVLTTHVTDLVAGTDALQDTFCTAQGTFSISALVATGLQI